VFNNVQILLFHSVVDLRSSWSPGTSRPLTCSLGLGGCGPGLGLEGCGLVLVLRAVVLVLVLRAVVLSWF